MVITKYSEKIEVVTVGALFSPQRPPHPSNYPNMLFVVHAKVVDQLSEGKKKNASKTIGGDDGRIFIAEEANY